MPLDLVRHQPSLPGLCPVEAAVASMAAAGMEERGAVFTRREVVDFILDLIGYTADRPLHQARILEPAVGQGDFLLPTIDRLMAAYARFAGAERRDIVADLGDCLLAVELHRASFERTLGMVVEALRGKGISARDAATLASRWLRHGDFLLVPIEGAFSHVVGNPPYVRQERIPDALMEEYRRRYSTIYDRADIYVPFIERSLSLLAPDGQLGFICADRWMKNRYGGPLRRFVANGFHLRHVVDMVGTDAFLSEVSAYPAIVTIARQKPGPTRLACRPAIDATAMRALAGSLTARKLQAGCGVSEVSAIVRDAEPWMLDASDMMVVVRRLEAEYPGLEEAGCKVGIGVATGADQAFIGPYDKLDVEADRKLPLVMTGDILTGSVAWRGLGVVNPFGPDGKLVPLSAYPKLAAHLAQHGAAIRARHISKKNPGSWYRTIDRIYPELAAVPKLLIPDIKGDAHIVYEEGRLYPHHNLYFITSDTWNLHALQAVMLSDVTRAFIGSYSTKMRGGYLRFQAQYLRRLRIPHWRDVPRQIGDALMRAGLSRDPAACNAAVASLYSLTAPEQQALATTRKVIDAA